MAGRTKAAEIEFAHADDTTQPSFDVFSESINVQGRFFKLRISTLDDAVVYGIQIETAAVRNWG